MDSADEAELRDLINDVVQAAKITAKKRFVSIKPTIENLTSRAYDQGLSPDALSELISLITKPSHLDQASLNSLISNLYPSSRISSDVILRVIGCLGRGELKPSLPIQAGLLRWLVMVYQTIETPAILSQSYAILFNLLDTAAIRFALYLRNEIGLSRQTGHDPALTGLLRIFKDYYPEIIVGDAIKGKASAFKHPDTQWRDRLGVIQRDYAQRSTAAVSQPQNGFTVSRHTASGGRGPRPSGVPAVHTSYADETSVTLEEIDSADRLAQTLEKIEVPNQLAAVLADPLLQNFVALRKDDVMSRRIVHWLDALLDDVVSGNADTKTFEDTMEVLQDYVSRETPPVVLNFLAKLFERWDGVEAQGRILGILQYTTLSRFDELKRLLFQPLEKCLPRTPSNQILLLDTYRGLLHNWTSILLSLDSIPSDTPFDAVRQLQIHANALSLSLIQACPSTATNGAVLDFYEQVAATTSHPTLQPHLRIAIPSPALVYLVFFSPSLGNVSRLTGVLARYKTAFDAAMARSKTAYTSADLRTFNSFLMDLCNCLWRGRAFNATDTNALGCLAPRAATSRYQRYAEDLGSDLALPLLFGLSHSPLLSLQSISCVRALEDEAFRGDGGVMIATRHAGPVTQASLQRLAAARGLPLKWAEYRLQVLRHLEREGFVGVMDFMKNILKVLQGTGNASSQGSQGSRASLG
ncbi:hypothetical protein D7B24_002930 [Verticillium nonalfalfae]|uniref:Uncharacterized protein n=1 Tax=Verticillium nonalfalfae TaxID=1051616 RepID=A0A3M9XY88_9PEZI|nr:uncharacterized protein D7B24_002930 [Verticillium nonalfalfae]RNJ52752.1 hypothetical protein D7B24_002930 [Verticillium nonalfalfae]